MLSTSTVCSASPPVAAVFQLAIDDDECLDDTAVLDARWSVAVRGERGAAEAAVVIASGVVVTDQVAGRLPAGRAACELGEGPMATFT